MRDLMGIMKQAQAMQQKMQDVQAELDTTRGRGLVRRRHRHGRMTAKGQVKAVSHRSLAARRGREGDRRGPHRRGAQRRARQGRARRAGAPGRGDQGPAPAAGAEAVLMRGDAASPLSRLRKRVGVREESPALPSPGRRFRANSTSPASGRGELPQSVAGPEIERLIQLLARLPGLGPRSARRVALHLIKKREQLLAPLSEALRGRERAHRRLPHLRQRRHRRSLHGVPRSAPRPVDPRRRRGRVRSVGARAGRRGARARYHVLGGRALAARRRAPRAPQPRRPRRPRRRVRRSSEVILALNATVDGQTTAHYVTELLSTCRSR